MQLQSKIGWLIRFCLYPSGPKTFFFLAFSLFPSVVLTKIEIAFIIFKAKSFCCWWFFDMNSWCDIGKNRYLSQQQSIKNLGYLFVIWVFGPLSFWMWNSIKWLRSEYNWQLLRLVLTTWVKILRFRSLWHNLPFLLWCTLTLIKRKITQPNKMYSSEF